jgi:peptidoglycan hydrolase-like protein with peptidoglycan-binding domain
MKMSFKEELLRIHTLSYGKQLIEEQAFLYKLMNMVDGTKDDKKADLVTQDVNLFYKTLSDAANSGGLAQQNLGSMQYQKAVESMQIGLILLGYSLPVHGVDGLFGPETAAAVHKFNSDNGLSTTTGGGASKETLNKLIILLQQKNITSSDISKHIDILTTGGGTGFTDLDLNSDQGYKSYSQICQTFIDSKPPNPLGITGDMMAYGARLAFQENHKYVPPELALGQLYLEGGIGNRDLNDKAVRTRNPFNLGNIDSGLTNQFRDVQTGINQYYSLIARNYLGSGKTASDLASNFVDKSGNRYASANNYEMKLNNIASQINKTQKNLT